jgi:hypothetical protein
LNLVATKEAEMTEGERAVMLTALFRPAPGQPTDDAAPQTLLELIGKSPITK